MAGRYELVAMLPAHAACQWISGMACPTGKKTWPDASSADNCCTVTDYIGTITLYVM
jgi:hypothetical protein